MQNSKPRSRSANSSLKVKTSDNSPRKIVKDQKEVSKSERVSVFVRIRPFTSQETEPQRKSCITFVDTTNKTISRNDSNAEIFTYTILFQLEVD